MGGGADPALESARELRRAGAGRSDVERLLSRQAGLRDASIELRRAVHVVHCRASGLRRRGRLPSRAAGGGASCPAAVVCAVSYACGGSVLFQIYNVVFLVSAAWLPLAFLTAERMLAERSWKQSVWFGVTLAMMTLGGDPQTAYHAGLLALLYACFVKRPEPEVEQLMASSKSHRFRLVRRLAVSRAGLLGLAAGVGGLLAAIQILPAWEWNRVSDRAAFDRPRSLHEARSYLSDWIAGRAHKYQEFSDISQEMAQGIFGPPEPETHHAAIYDYSLSPRRLAEAVWPNFSGRLFPENRRWLAALPDEGRAWTPSIYAGLLPLLLALSGLRFWRGPTRQRWLSWVLLLSVLAALGWYGLGWLTQQARAALVDETEFPIGAPVGGLYWLLVNVLPGYAQFRYPAKWLVPATLALGLLAAGGWDRAFDQRPARLRWILVALGGVSLALLGGLMTLEPQWTAWLATVPKDDYFGPLDVVGSWYELYGALAQTTILCGVFWWLLGRAGVSHGWSWAAAALTAAELALAQGGLIATAPNEIFTTPSPLAARMAEQDAKDGILNYRVFRDSPKQWSPPEPRGGESRNRQQANARWERETLFPKYHLLERGPSISLVESSNTMMSQDFALFMFEARSFYTKTSSRVPPVSILAALSAKYFILQEQPTNGKGWTQFPEDVLWQYDGARSRAYLSHTTNRWPVNSNDPRGAAQEALWTLVASHNGAAIIESSTYLPSDDWPGDPPSPAETCTFVRDDPQRIEIDAALEQPGLLVLGDLYFPGWTASATNEATGETTPLEIFRTNRIMRGVFLPPGKHRVTFAYRPATFYLGATLSGLAWLTLLGAALLPKLQRPPARPIASDSI